MKKIFVFFAAALLLFSCTDEPLEQASVSSELTVQKSDVIFDALGGSGTITVADLGGAKLTAFSASEWCTVSVSGNTVSVTADQNVSLDGRSSRITLYSGDSKTYVIAQQTGMEYSFLDAMFLAEMEGGQFDIAGISTFPVEASTEYDWIKYVETDGGYKLTVSPNDSGNSRVGTFVLRCGDVETTYTVRQKFDRVFSGNYTIDYYTSSAKAVHKTLDVVIERDADDLDQYYICGVSPHGHKIPIKFDPATELLVIPNCAYLGPYSEGVWEYTIVNYATLDFKGNYVSYTQSDAYNIYFTFKYEGGKYTLELYNSAPMFNKARVSTGISIYAFKAEEGVAPGSANRVGSVIGLIFPTFTQK
ncbi:MAG: BACON domain-containing protein [Candidatus Cryptobacteroides sp.]